MTNNSYGFNGVIPDKAIAAEYNSENGEYTGQFYFLGDDIPETASPVYGVNCFQLGEVVVYDKLFLKEANAIKYVKEIEESGYRVIDLLNDVIVFEQQ